MNGSGTGWTVAAWILEAFADPELLVVLAGGVVALTGFWVRARIDRVRSQMVARAGDDLI